MRFVTLFGLVGLLTGPVFAQGAIPSSASIDTSQFAKAADQADLASKVSALSAGAVKSVAGNAPDQNGNVTLPTSFTGISMSNTTFTGGATLNGTSLATLNDVAASTASEAAARASAGYAKTINGITPDASGNVLVPVPAAYSDAQAVAANAPAIAAAVAPTVKSVNGVTPVAGAVTIPTTTFISGFMPGSPGTWAGLLSSAPCNASRLASYAVVSDLYSGSASTNEVARCTLSGSVYYWRPQRTDFAASVPATGGTLNITCGVTAPILFLTGTLASNQTLAFNTGGCWPGAQISIANNLSLGVFTLTSTGLIGGATKTLGLNGRASYYFDGSGWQPF